MEIARNLMRIPKNCGNLFKKLLLVGPCVCWSEWPGGKQTAYIHLPVHFPIHNLAVAFGTREMRCNSNPAPCPPFFTPPPPSALLTTHFLPYSPPLSPTLWYRHPPPLTALWPSCGQEVMINNYMFSVFFWGNHSALLGPQFGTRPEV